MKHPTGVVTLLLKAGLIGALASGFGWLAGTTSGLQFLAARTLPYLPATFDPDQVQGRLIGPISLGPVQFAADGVSGEVESVKLDWRASALLRRTIHLLELRIVKPRLALHSESEAPFSLPLPLTLIIDELSIEDGELQLRDATMVSAVHLELAGRASSSRLELDRLNLQSSLGRLSGYVQASMEARAPWDITLAWEFGWNSVTVAGETRVDGPLERLNVTQSLSAPFTAHLEGVVHGLPDAPAWRLELLVDPLPPESGLWPEAVDGLATSILIEGDGADSKLEGLVEAPAHVPGPVAITAHASWVDDAVELRHLGLKLQDGANVTVRGRLATGSRPVASFALEGVGLGWPLGQTDQAVEFPQFTLSGSGTADQWRVKAAARARRAGMPEVDLEASLAWAGQLLTMDRFELVSQDGEIRASGSGTIDVTPASMAYRISADADISLADYPPVKGSLTAAGDRQGLQIENLAAELLDGSLEGVGRIAWADDAAATFNFGFTDLDPVSIAPDWPGRLSGQLELRGLPTAPDGLEVTLESLHGVLRSLPVAGSATFNATADAYRLRAAALTFGGASLAASGSLDGEALRLDADLGIPSIAAFHDGASGRLRLSTRVDGPRHAPRIDLEADGEQLRWEGYQAGALRVTADVDLAGAQTSHVALTLDDLATASGPGGSLRFEAGGVPADHRARLIYDRQLLEQQLALAVTGGVTGGLWSGLLTELSVAQAQRELWALQSPAQLTGGAASVSLREACLDGTLGRLCVDGEWRRDGPWYGEAKLSGMNFGSVSEWLIGGSRARGMFGGHVEVAGDGVTFHSLSGALELTDGDISLGEEHSSPLIAWDGGVLELIGDEREALATLTLGLVNADHVDGQLSIGWNVPDPPLNGRLEAELRQLQLLSEIVPDIAELGGRASVRAAISGTIGAPELTGRFEWLDGTANIPTLGLEPTAIRLVADFADGILEFEATGNSGEGTVTSDGRFSFTRGMVEGSASLRGENVLIVALPEARVTASPNVLMNFSGQALVIEGEVRIPFARIGSARGPMAVRTSRDEVILGALARDERAGFAVSSRVRVTVGPDVQIQAAGLRGGIEGSILTAIQPDAPPWGRGELRIKNGTFGAFGQQLDIESGRLIYTGGPLDNPGLEIRSVRRAGSVTAGAQVRGTLQEPVISIFSDPPMARAEALAYLTFGRGLGELQATERGTIQGAASSLALSASGLIATDIGRRLGFDNVQVEADDQTGDPSLTLGRYLGGGIYVGYGLGLFDAVNTLRLRFQINSRLSLEATSGEAVSADLFHTIERD